VRITILAAALSIPISILGAAPSAWSQAATTAPAHKPRIAVMDFDYATVKTDSAALFGSDQDIGSGIARFLEENLVKDGRYTLIDRKQIETVMKEQNFSNSDRADPTNAAKIGRLLSVDAILVGSITEFGNEKKNVGVGGGIINTHGIGAGGFGHSKTKAHVGITAKLVNIDTGEILAVEDAKGESSRGGFSVGGGGGEWWKGGGGGQLNMGSSDFQNTIIGEATKSAVDNLSSSLEADSAKITPRTVVVEGIVAGVSGTDIVLNIGSRSGIKVGDQFNVLRVKSEIKDPTTGAVIRRLTDTIGVIKATDVDEGSAVCAPVSGTDFKIGDRIKTVVQ
jgi:curli biogenesis system outer membrane secretion channel CsgG